MFTDNPSYFTVAAGSDTPTQTTFGFLKCASRMGNTDSVSSSSDCSLNRQLTPRSAGQPKFSGMRSFLRSVSSTSADSNQELLIMGEPRLSDIAPDLAYKHPASQEPRRSNSLKNTKSQFQDLMYCPLPTSEEAAIAAEMYGKEEVLITEDSARYYNCSAIKPEQRRHSIGTFMTRERTVSIASSSRSFKDDIPEGIACGDDGLKPGGTAIDDHSLRHGSYPRKRCSRCTRGESIKLSVLFMRLFLLKGVLGNLSMFCDLIIETITLLSFTLRYNYMIAFDHSS